MRNTLGLEPPIPPPRSAPFCKHHAPAPTRSVAQAQVELRTVVDRWRHSELKERQAFQTWFHDFCDALGVERPGPEGAGDYCFELPRRMVRPDDSETTGFIDCWNSLMSPSKRRPRVSP